MVAPIIAGEGVNHAPGTRFPDKKERLKRPISATDRQIGNLVYELYGLTEKIKIVEGQSMSS